MKTEKEKAIYLTDSIYEAAFLLAKGFPHLRTENSITTYKKIIFEDSPDLQKAIAFFYGNGKVPVLSFVNSYKKIKGEIFSRDSIKQ